MAEQARALDPKALEEVAESLAAGAGRELATLLSRKIEVKGGIVESVTAEEACAHPAALVVADCHSADGAVALHLVLARPDAVALAGLQLGEDAEAIARRREDALEEDQLAAFQGVAKALVAAIGRALEEGCGLASLRLDGIQEVEEPSADGGFLDAAQALRMSFDLCIEGLPKGALELLLLDGAEAGAAAAPSGAPLVLIDPSEEERTRVEGFEAGLERRVSALDPRDFTVPDPDLLAEAAAVVVAWDLGGRPGLDLVEHLAADPRTAAVPLLMASEAPTRGMVAAALRAGARSFLLRPYDVGELRRRALGERRP